MKKICQEYYFSVEGKTEKWYFEHLQNLINKNEQLKSKVKFKIDIETSIISRAKSIPGIFPTKVFHICDYESQEDEHTEHFNKTLIELNSVKKINRNLNYKLGYSNFSFDLWMILHKNFQKAPVTHRKQYVKGINKAYDEDFTNLKDYKKERNFKRILTKIELSDVIKAVENANKIRGINDRVYTDKCKLFGKFKYYTENPDLTINECVEQILKGCGAIPK